MKTKHNDHSKDITNQHLDNDGTTFDQLTPLQQRRALVVFAEELPKYLETDLPEYCSKEDVLEKVSKAINDMSQGRTLSLKLRQFERLLKELYKCNSIAITPPTLSDPAQIIRKAFGLKEAVVVAGSSPKAFARVAAEQLVRELDQVARVHLDSDKPTDIYLGLISGRTVQTVIDAICALHWSKELCIDPNDWPPVHIIACNVSFTAPDFIGGNATILAHRLSEKLRQEGISKAFAYGLNAPLTVTIEELKKVDSTPQTKDVLMHTDPCRVMENCDPQRTNLDILLTGVGERPQKAQCDQGSIFYKLARENGVDMDVFQENSVQGDLALIPLGPNGQPVEMKNTNGDKIIFYSAVSLPVLEAMASNSKKSVMLVAQSTIAKNKIPAIVASMGGVSARPGVRRRYISQLIIDEPTGKDLIHYMGFPLRRYSTDNS